MRLGKRYGNLLVFIYAIVKLLFLANIGGQFVLMNKFLGSNYTLCATVAAVHMFL